MKLTARQFEKRLADGSLTISLIGMSNTGKTFWGKRLALAGFRHWICDKAIEERLGFSHETDTPQGIEAVAAWMGQPHEKRFKKNQASYLAREAETLRNILAQLKKEKGNWVIDTTGSVVYVGEKLCRQLQKNTLTVWIKATQDMKDAMFEKFLRHPKPIVWGKHYRPKPGESADQTIKRCYPELLKYRTRLYARHADVAIPYEFLDKNITGETLLERVKSYL